MIEGLRLLPWFQEAVRKNPHSMSRLKDCGKCMQTTKAEIRQMLGCGYEPPIEQATPWQPPSGPAAYQYGKPSVCAGYSTNLPEVNETAQARAHWKHGAIDAFCDGAKPSESLLQSVLILDAACSAVDSWRVTPAKDGGGGS